MSKTVRGIYKNLEESEYTVTVNGTVYFFSSILYMTKFEHELEDNRKKLKTLLEQQRIDFLYFDELADYRLYLKIEKRGFCVGVNFSDGTLAYLCNTPKEFRYYVLDEKYPNNEV